MENDVEPASNRVVWGVLPGLEAVAMADVVCWLPVVERLVTVLNRGEEGGDEVGSEEDVECRDWFDRESILDSSV